MSTWDESLLPFIQESSQHIWEQNSYVEKHPWGWGEQVEWPSMGRWGSGDFWHRETQGSQRLQG